MISKANRFHGHNSLSSIYRKGQAVNVPGLSLKVLPNRGEKPYRLAVVVSRKVDKSAVVRNRIRRRLYEAVRQNPDLIKLTSDLVLNVYNQQLATMPSSELEATIKELLVKAGLSGQPKQPSRAKLNRRGDPS